MRWHALRELIELLCGRWCNRHAQGYRSDFCPMCNGEKIARMESTDTRRLAKPHGSYPLVKWSEKEDGISEFDVARVNRHIKAKRRSE